MKEQFAGVTRIIVSTCLCVFLGFVAVVTCAAAAEPIRIGHVCSITGWAGMLGSPQRDAMLAMVEDINGKGGLLGRQIEVFIEDDQSNPTTAVLAATKLVRDLKVNLLVAATLSDCAMSIMPVAEQEQVPYTSPRRWSFPLRSGSSRSVRAISRWLPAHFELAVTTLGAKHIALLRDTALYGMQGAKNLKNEIRRYPGVSFVLEETFDVKDTSMVPQLTKIKAADPDLMIIYSTGAVCAIIAKNYKQLGMKTPVLGAGGVSAPDFVKVGGAIAEECKWIISTLKISVAASFPRTTSIGGPFTNPRRASSRTSMARIRT